MTNGLLRRDRAALLVVDVQEKMARVMPERETTVERCVRLARGCRRLGVPVLVTEQYPEGLGPTVSELAEVLEGIEPLRKMTFSCCGPPGDDRNPLLAALERSGRRQIVLCGMETHVCVLQTALVLEERGYEPVVAADAVCSRDPAHKHNALERLARAGVGISNYESVLFELLDTAEAPEFRDISKLVR